MKSITILLLASLIVIFGMSIYNSINSFNKLVFTSDISDNNIYGFDPELNQNKGFVELESKITTLIKSEKKSINDLSIWTIVLNLVITIVTGLAALITTISTIKNSSITKSTAILVAVITFVSSMLSYSLGQVNTFKDDAENKRQRIIKIREELESLKPDEVNGQLPLFNRKLDEEL